MQFHNIPVSYGSKIKGNNLERTTLEDVIDKIRSDKDLTSKVTAMRAGTDEGKRREAKSALPYFNLGIFKGDNRKAEALESTQFMLFDFDKVSGLDDLRAKVESDPEVLFSFVSPSGNGLKVAFRLDRTITDHKEFSAIYIHYLGVFFERYGVEPDKSTKDASRACFFSSDPDLYLNPDATPLSTNVLKPQTGKINFVEVGIQEAIQDSALVPAAIEHLRLHKLGYHNWLRCGIALTSLGEAGREHFLRLSINEHYSDTEEQLHAKFDEFLSSAKGEVDLATLFHIAKDFGFTYQGMPQTLTPASDFADELASQWELDDERDPHTLLGFKLKKFAQLAQHCDGLQAGFYHLAAETNVGKTAVLTNMTLDVLESNPDVRVLYFSLDDNRLYTIYRMLSILTGYPINDVKRPKTLGTVQKGALDAARTILIKYVRDGRLVMRDIAEIQHVNQIEAEIQAMNAEGNLVVFVDGLYNLQVGQGSESIRVENIERAQKVKMLVDTYKIPFISTGELRKKTKDEGIDKAPTLHDLMETGKFAYNANVVWLLYASGVGSVLDPDLELTLQFAKNKLSDFKSYVSLNFKRKTGTMEERKPEAPFTRQMSPAPGTEDLFTNEGEN